MQWHRAIGWEHIPKHWPVLWQLPWLLDPPTHPDGSDGLMMEGFIRFGMQLCLKNCEMFEKEPITGRRALLGLDTYWLGPRMRCSLLAKESIAHISFDTVPVQ